MRYRFIVDELEELTVFLSEAMEWVQSIVNQVLRLVATSDTTQLSLVFEDVFCQLHMLKSRSLFWGLMDMAMLICQAEFMFRALRCGRLLINLETIGLLRDITNTCQTMICELHQAIECFQESKALEIELACSQDVEWLIDFLQQLLQEKPSRALVEKSNEDSMDSSSEIINTSHEVVEVAISTSLTVTDEKVDSLLQLIGELATAKNVFNKMSSSLMMEHNLPNLSQEAKAGGEFIHWVAAAMEDAVMSMRRVELGLIFLQFPHIAKDIGAQTGKDICLTIEGENTTADKILVKQLYNLLLKIIRTMAKFSIEAPAEREAVGKELQGHIWLTAYSLGKQIVIEVEDDGQGMKGGDADAKVLGISDLMVTMNEVYHQMDALPGNLEMTSLPGKGSKVTITLPPTLMRCSGLLVEVSGDLFIVPLDNVVEIVSVTTKQLVSKRGRQLLYHRGEVLGIVSLAEVLGMIELQTEVGVTVLVVTNEQDKVGLIVHKLHNEQEIVVKALPDYLKNFEYIGGAAITGDGKVALVLNVSVLIKKNNPNNCSS